MTVVRHTVEIARPPAVVYERLTDVGHIQEWAPVVLDSVCSDGMTRVGTSFAVSFDLKSVGGPKFRFQNTISELVRDQKVVWHQTRGPMRSLDWVFELAPTSQGTQLEAAIRYEMPYSLLGRLMDWLKMTRVVASACRVNLEGLKKSLEQNESTEGLKGPEMAGVGPSGNAHQ